MQQYETWNKNTQWNKFFKIKLYHVLKYRNDPKKSNKVFGKILIYLQCDFRMQEIEFNKLSYVSSEDKEFPGNNLVHNKKWLCKAAEAKAVVKLQLKNDNQINKVEIRNEGSAFVEVLVGKENMEDDDFQVLLSCSSFMNPAESENGKNKHQVKVFSKDQLQKSVSEQAWNIVKVVCTQPFNKKVGFGLGFIKLFSAHNVSSSSSLPLENTTNGSIQTDSTKQTDLGLFKLKKTKDCSPSITIGSFFRRSREASQDDGNQGCKKIKIDTDTKGLKDIHSSGSSEKMSSTTKNNNFSKSPELQSNGTQSNNKTPTTKALPPQQPSTHNQTMNGTPTQSITNPPSVSLSSRKHPTQKSSSKQPSDLQPTKPTVTPQVAISSSPHQASSSSTSPPLMRSPTDVLTGVVFVLSGFQNPERSTLRDMATGMGAVYCHDWCPEATHLICAFADTPKYTQVNGKGRIVKKEWLLQCHRQHKLLSWKRYRLGKAKSPNKNLIDDRVEEDDNKGDDEDSEEDYEDSEDDFIVDDDEEEETEDDTEEEDDNVSKEEVSKNKKYKSLNSNSKKEVNNKASTLDVSSTNRLKSSNASSKKPSSPPSSPSSSSSPQPLSFQAPSSPQASSSHASPSSSSSFHYDKLISKAHKLPSLLNRMTIFFYGEFSSYEKNFLTRYIIAYDGKVCDYMGDDVQVVITKNNWDSNFDQTIKDNEDLVFLKPEWLLECINKQKLISFLPQFRVIKPSKNY